MSTTSTAVNPDATVLSYLMHKHPDKVQTFTLPVGNATVLYPAVGADTTSIAVIIDLDPIDLVQSRYRRGKGTDSFSLGQYVNDRPYAASSILAVAVSKLFRTALSGTCVSHPELVNTALALTVTIPVVPCGGDVELPGRLFEPLGWTVSAQPISLDPQVPQWGDSDYVSLTLTGEQTVQNALRHLYVLLPVLDEAKHYWVGPDEADKLVRVAGEWLAEHPQAQLIMNRYLARRRDLVESVVERLVPEAQQSEAEGAPADQRPSERPLARQRMDAMVSSLQGLPVRRIVDIGCGEGRLLESLMVHGRFERILGVDVSARELDRAERRLKINELSDFARERISLLQSSATYRDARLAGFDAAVLMEVIEHVDPPRLPALVRSVFVDMAPQFVLITTPNADYNVLYPALSAGEFRHHDHRFEFSREQFDAWASDIATTHGYSVTYDYIGDVHPEYDGPTQRAIFTKNGTDS